MTPDAIIFYHLINRKQSDDSSCWSNERCDFWRNRKGHNWTENLYTALSLIYLYRIDGRLLFTLLSPIHKIGVLNIFETVKCAIVVWICCIDMYAKSFDLIPCAILYDVINFIQICMSRYNNWIRCKDISVVKFWI